MSRKLHVFNIIVLFIYLWVIGTLPLHQHDHKVHESVAHQCDHSHDSKSAEKDCVICFNLFVPQAIDQIDIIEQIVFSTQYKSIYKELMPAYWHNITIKLSANKDPPILFIS